MVSALALSAIAMIDRPQARGGVPETDVLLDCRLHRADREAPGSAIDIPYALYLAGSRQPAGEADDDAPVGMDTFDPNRITGHGRGAYSVFHGWPVFLRVGFPDDSGPGIHGETLPATMGGGVFQTLRIDRDHGIAQVAVLQYGLMGDRRRPGPAPVSARYYGHCRILEGDGAATTFRDMHQ